MHLIVDCCGYDYFNKAPNSSLSPASCLGSHFARRAIGRRGGHFSFQMTPRLLGETLGVSVQCAHGPFNKFVSCSPIPWIPHLHARPRSRMRLPGLIFSSTPSFHIRVGILPSCGGFFGVSICQMTTFPQMERVHCIVHFTPQS